MNQQTHEMAKTAHLKESIGHALTAEEQLALRSFLATDEGRAFAEGTEMMRSALATPEPPIPTVDAPALVARFESQMKSDAHKLLQPGNCARFYAGFALVALLGSLLMLFVPHPTHGTTERIQGSVILSVMIMGFAGLVHLRAFLITRRDDLFRWEWKAEASRRAPARVVGFLLIVWILGIFGGWTQALVLAGFVLVMTAVVRWLQHRTRMRQDAELWGWWEETLR